MYIRFCHDYRSLPFSSRGLTDLAKRFYAEQKIPPARETHVILCSDYKIRRLNRDYRNIDRPTDVLSFEFGDSDLLGEIYISLQRADVQARRYGHTYRQELRRLLIHGLCHLAGYDHMTESERARMEAVEQRYGCLSSDC